MPGWPCSCTAASAASSSRSTWPQYALRRPWPRSSSRDRCGALLSGRAGTGWPRWSPSWHDPDAPTPRIFAVMQPLRGPRRPAAAAAEMLGLSAARSPSARPRSAWSWPAPPCTDPAALALLALPTVPDHRRLPRLHRRPRAAGEPAPAARGDLAAARRRRRQEALGDFLDAVRSAFRAEMAELVLLGPAGREGATVSRSREGERARRHGARSTTPRTTTACSAWPPRRGALTTRTGTGRGSSWTRYAAGRGLKDAMAAALRTDDRVHGLLLVGGRLGDVTHLQLAATSRCWTPSPATWRPRSSAAAWRRTSARSPTSRSSCGTRRCTTR